MTRGDLQAITRRAERSRKAAEAQAVLAKKYEELEREQARLARLCAGCSNERPLVPHTKLCGYCFDHQMRGAPK